MYRAHSTNEVTPYYHVTRKQSFNGNALRPNSREMDKMGITRILKGGLFAKKSWIFTVNILMGSLKYSKRHFFHPVSNGSNANKHFPQNTIVDPLSSILLKQQTSAKIWRMPDYVLLKTVAICHWWSSILYLPPSTDKILRKGAFDG
jgi:hypothetical protein